MLIAASGGTMAAEDAIAAPVPPAEREMEIIDIEEDTIAVFDVDTASQGNGDANAKTFGLWRGLPFSWWPSKFCSWDYWTNAAWTVTLVGSATCDSQTGKALATLARQGVTTNRDIMRLSRGRLGNVTTATVLCARSGLNRLRYTIRLNAPKSTITMLRQPLVSPIMRSVFNRNTVRRTIAGKNKSPPTFMPCQKLNLPLMCHALIVRSSKPGLALNDLSRLAFLGSFLALMGSNPN
jgi:hypothetical protein